MAWQRKCSAGSFIEWESSLSSLPWCHFLSNRSSVSERWILSLSRQPTDLIFCPVKINEMLSISGVHLGREDSMHLDFSVWPKESGEFCCLQWWGDDWPPGCSPTLQNRKWQKSAMWHLFNTVLITLPLGIENYNLLLYCTGKSCPCLQYNDIISKDWVPTKMSLSPWRLNKTINHHCRIITRMGSYFFHHLSDFQFYLTNWRGPKSQIQTITNHPQINCVSRPLMYPENVWLISVSAANYVYRHLSWQGKWKLIWNDLMPNK